MNTTYKDIFTLKEKVVIITGGSGYLGSVITKGLLEFGASVVVFDIDNKKTNEIVNNRENKNNFSTLVCDVQDTLSVKEMYRKVSLEIGNIGVLINCAAYVGYSGSGSVADMDDETWEKGISGTAGSTFRCTREVIPYMEENKGGSIINFGSMYGMVSPDFSVYGNKGNTNPPNYGSGKAAIIQLTKYCASQLAKKNIRVNCISPGPFPNKQVQANTEFIENLSKKTMLGRIGRPDELIGAVVLLASDASSYMTGANIVVDGGWTAW
jgi:NAD(P)-dependent dehydrogenase (short-subunit alcohol dehydrogenase family)